ncbi:MAG: M48 family metalloprotease [Candidatus Omnitrophica bacterium]|nr:M48 family metalloprotease [Candidatus Omnitrophota bacterium]
MKLKTFLILVLLFVFLSGCANTYNPATGKNEFIIIGTSSEVSLGKQVARQIAWEKQIIKTGFQQLRVQRIGERLAKHSDRKDLEYNFFLVKDEELNAFAVPGGFIYINTGLAERATEDELACVIAHEIVHVAARHSVKNLQASLGYQLLISIALGNKNQIRTRQISDMVFNLSRLGYSRSDETLADKLGVKYAHLAGYNPQGMISFFEKLKQEALKHGGALRIEIFSSHPDIDKRILTTKEEIKKLQ